LLFRNQTVFLLTFSISYFLYFVALSLNDFRLQGCDRHLVVKYAEDQHKKKDRRGQMGTGHPFNNSNGMEDSMGQDSRDPYYYPRSRGVPPAMYRNQQATTMLMGHNSTGLESQYIPSTSVGYAPSRNIGKNVGSSSMSGDVSPINSLDWYGQMPQMVYDGQMVHNQSQMHNQAIGYDQHSVNQHMMSQGQSQQRAGQGVVYMRTPRVIQQESGYNSSATLIVSSLPQHVDVALLHDLCSPYGQIISAQVDVDPSSSQQDGPAGRGACSGRGRVQMANLSQAQYATQALNGAIIFEGGRPLQVIAVRPLIF
jgi:RNA recognition motif. (a.k.a. RRM, RBD, or RNP domain)